MIYIVFEEKKKSFIYMVTTDYNKAKACAIKHVKYCGGDTTVLLSYVDGKKYTPDEAENVEEIGGK